ncbi:MAG TPA: hypothetical protein P5548_01500 [Candidatus Moranbacteria bacterium]|nr:hypothetical protein [Candidatus Moranbacteria bacterium]HRZ33565.1 hypothetical protein [Candidatus Moranbacteria bacterium]
MESINEELSIEENLWADLDEFVVKYMKLIPNANFNDDDFWKVASDMLSYFNESVDRIMAEKSKQKNKTEPS